MERVRLLDIITFAPSDSGNWLAVCKASRSSHLRAIVAVFAVDIHVMELQSIVGSTKFEMKLEKNVRGSGMFMQGCRGKY
jgi:hypothetical protein